MKTFHERLTEHENERHARRIAEISRMKTMLALAEPIIQKLEASLKLELRLDDCLSYLPTADYLPLRLAAGPFSLTDNKMYELLVDLGFVEVARFSYGRFDDVIIAKDGLAIALDALPRRAEALEKDSLAEFILNDFKRRHNDSQVTA
jgi:hypothetical protein